MLKRKHEVLIDLIQAIRAKNNQNWMTLLRIAFDKDPVRAGKVMQKITDNDAKINKLSKKLGG